MDWVRGCRIFSPYAGNGIGVQFTTFATGTAEDGRGPWGTADCRDGTSDVL